MEPPDRTASERLVDRTRALARSRANHPTARTSTLGSADPASVTVLCHPDQDIPLTFDGFRSLTDVVAAAAWVIVHYTDVIVIVDDPALPLTQRTREEARISRAAFDLASTVELC